MLFPRDTIHKNIYLLEVKDRLDILRGVVVFLQKTTTFEKKFREVKKDIVLHMTIFFCRTIFDHFQDNSVNLICNQ